MKKGVSKFDCLAWIVSKIENLFEMDKPGESPVFLMIKHFYYSRIDVGSEYNML